MARTTTATAETQNSAMKYENLNPVIYVFTALSVVVNVLHSAIAFMHPSQHPHPCRDILSSLVTTSPLLLLPGVVLWKRSAAARDTRTRCAILAGALLLVAGSVVLFISGLIELRRP